MKCPSCGQNKDTVIDSRPLGDHSAIRRRRECSVCQARFTTYEYVEGAQLTVIKSDGRREVYSRAKLRRGILQALHKRGYGEAQVDELIDSVERVVQAGAAASGEIESQRLGRIVLDRLLAFDEVAYIRFASVYRRFQDAEGFLNELHTLRESLPQGGA
ncbi:MAG: transcriptional repressor NrdR [Calditrichaeota bacterium]|nr:transcriptional repressor NrdR [Candidatus Cloacimonadota bacterium]MCB1046962.1 transcriptional repressor NrdR [Calditrichota bacterium]MCB9472226.1 transcriptional repressor NrdR [Candidatus Delongbacteria bacterium]MCB9475188.1 transcriptional repressor NrdR [Candidatus Delongbacteria bacterium]